MNYEQDLAIDPDSLDTEWLEQPRLMLRYAKHASKMKMEVERAKERLDIIRAGLDKKIRIDPADFGIVKLTVKFLFVPINIESKFCVVQLFNQTVWNVEGVNLTLTSLRSAFPVAFICTNCSNSLLV